MSDNPRPGETPATGSLPPTSALPGGVPDMLQASISDFASGEIPKRFGSYLLKEKLGQGGMGVVYKAWDENLDRPAAIKVLSPRLKALPEALERLKAEARAAARLNHPNIVSVYAFGEDEGWSWIAMELVEGRDLGKVLKAVGALDPARAIKYALEATEALEYASRHRIIHRDIKPSNIFVGSDDRARVMDFGLAKRLDTEAGLTATGSTLGTPDYMSPEQALSRALDHRTDIYSLGCTLFSLLAGHRPFSGSSATEVIMQHVQTPLVIPREWNRIAGGRLANLVEHMTRKDADQRIQTWAEVAAELKEIEKILKGGAPARPVRRTGNRKPVLVATAIAAAVIAVAAGIAGWPSNESGTSASASRTPPPSPTSTPAPTSVVIAQPTPLATAEPPLASPEHGEYEAPVSREELVQALYEGRWDDAREMAPRLDPNTISSGAHRIAMLREDIALAAEQAMGIEKALLAEQDSTSTTVEQRDQIIINRLQERGTEMDFVEAWSSVLFLTFHKHPSAPELAYYLQEKFPPSPLTGKQLAVLHAVGMFMTPEQGNVWDRIKPRGAGGPGTARQQPPNQPRLPGRAVGRP